MAVAYILDFADGDAGAYDRVMDRMGLDGNTPPGCIFHVAGAFDGGWRVVDVWETDEAFQTWATEKVGPLTQAEGLPEPSVTRVEVHRSMDERDRGRTMQVFQIVRLPGIDQETFDAKDPEVRQGGVPEGLVFHVNGPVEGGWLVADGWTDKAIRDEFIARRIVPVMSEVLEGPPSIEDMQVYNVLAASTRLSSAV